MRIFIFIYFTSILFLTAQEKSFIPIDSSNTGIFQINTIPTQMKLDEAKRTFGTINEKVSFGLSLGFNKSLEKQKTIQISPINNTLIINRIQSTSFVLSSVISVPVFYKEKGYRLLDIKGKEQGQLHFVSNWSIIGVVNLVTLSEAETGSVFNQKISGGLGISYNLNEDVAIAMSYELISYRKPRGFILDLEGQEVINNEIPLTTIDINDNNYFFDRYAGTVSLKMVYKLTTD